MKKIKIFLVIFMLLGFILMINVNFSEGVWVKYKGTTTTVDIGGTHIIACDCTDTTDENCNCMIWIPPVSWPI